MNDIEIQNHNLHYFNGKWVEAKDLKLSVFDLTVIRGYGVFDFVRSYSGIFVWLDEHIERFFASAKSFQLDIPISKKELMHLFNQAILLNNDADIFVRVLLTGGISEDTLTKGRDNSLILIVNYCKPINKEIYESGVTFATFPAPRQLPGIKSTNYATSLYARYIANDKSIADVLLVGGGSNPKVYEAAVNSIFFVCNNKIITTPEDKVLGGIVRRKALDLLIESGYEVDEKFIRVSDINDMDECFATNSSLKAYPVTRINNIHISKGMGPITQFVFEGLSAAIESEVAIAKNVNSLR